MHARRFPAFKSTLSRSQVGQTHSLLALTTPLSPQLSSSLSKTSPSLCAAHDFSYHHFRPAVLNSSSFSSSYCNPPTHHTQTLTTLRNDEILFSAHLIGLVWRSGRGLAVEGCKQSHGLARVSASPWPRRSLKALALPRSATSSSLEITLTQHASWHRCAALK